MSPFLHLLFLLSAETAAREPEAAISISQANVIEIVIAGPAAGRTELEQTIRPLLGDAPDLRWSVKERVPVDEAMPTATSEGGGQIWIDLTNPVRLRVYLPAEAPSGAATVRTVERPAGQDADLVVRETVAQIVKAAVHGLRSGRSAAAGEIEPEPFEPAPAVTAPATAAVAGSPGAAEPPRGRFSVVLSGGAHTSPFNLAEPAGDKNWLGAAVVGQIRWHLDKYLLGLRLGWETSDRSVDRYYLRNTYLTATAAGFRFFETGIASFGIGVEAGLLVLHQNTWLDGVFWETNGFSNAATLPGQTGQTNSTGMLFGPVVEFNLAPMPQLFLHLDGSMPIALLRTMDMAGTQWKSSHYFRATVGVGFRL